VNKEGWPEFPLWWLVKEKKNMEGLRDIANHLYGKTHHTSHQGFMGEASEMDKQIINSISDLRERVAHTTDVLQSTLEIIAEDYWRRTHKMERLLAWIRNVARQVETKLAENVFYRILAIASTLGLLLGLVKFLVHIMRGR
jgi:hypothetical protein